MDPAALTVTFRIFLFHYEPSWEHTPLLPDDRGFFFEVLREAAERAEAKRSGALDDLVSPQEYLNTEWVDANASRFVAAVTRMATLNQPRTDGEFSALAAFHVDHYASLDALSYRKGAPWSEEHRLVQADYQVQVTDRRWLAPLERGQGWCTLAHPSPTDRTATGPAADPYVSRGVGGRTGAGRGGRGQPPAGPPTVCGRRPRRCPCRLPAGG